MSRGSPRPRKRMSGRTEDMFGHDFDPLTFEQGARKSGYTRIAGLDEAGRGPLAGPVVAAAVILPKGLLISGLTDSKLVGEADRERLFDQILTEADCHGIGIVDERTIDEVNIYQASIIAMEKALEAIAPSPDYLLIDALTLPRVSLPQRSIIKGDYRSHTIAAASIIAKVTRDRLMRDTDRTYPGYGFAQHKGYGTRQHLACLRQLGPSPVHRRSFRPVKELSCVRYRWSSPPEAKT